VNFLLKLLRPVLNFFLQPHCPLCDRSTPDTLCIYCQRQLLAEKLERPLHQQSELKVWAWGSYGGALKRSIAQCKYQNHPEIAFYLGELLGQTWLAQNDSKLNPWLLPIPMHKDKQRQRGFNQAELIAKGFAHHTGRVDRSLQRIKSTEAQFGLSPQARRQNLEGAFQLDSKKRWGQHPVLIIDDIYTTGATIRAALAPLKTARVNVIGVAVAAIAGATS
jgi:ComF family protein